MKSELEEIINKVEDMVGACWIAGLTDVRIALEGVLSELYWAYREVTDLDVD